EPRSRIGVGDDALTDDDSLEGLQFNLQRHRCYLLAPTDERLNFAASRVTDAILTRNGIAAERIALPKIRASMPKCNKTMTLKRGAARAPLAAALGGWKARWIRFEPCRT